MSCYLPGVVLLHVPLSRASYCPGMRETGEWSTEGQTIPRNYRCIARPETCERNKCDTRSVPCCLILGVLDRSLHREATGRTWFVLGFCKGLFFCYMPARHVASVSRRVHDPELLYGEELRYD